MPQILSAPSHSKDSERVSDSHNHPEGVAAAFHSLTWSQFFIPFVFTFMHVPPSRILFHAKSKEQAGQGPAPTTTNSRGRQNVQSSLRDDAVGPLDQAHENGGTAEFCSPLRHVCFRDPTGHAAGPSSKNGDAFGHYFFEHFAERRPAHGHNSIGRGFAH